MIAPWVTRTPLQPLLLKDAEKKVEEILRGFFKLPWGSATEVVYLILHCKDIQLLSPQIYEDLQVETTQIKKMLASFIKKLRSEN